jgi:hypothetical protein
VCLQSRRVSASGSPYCQDLARTVNLMICITQSACWPLYVNVKDFETRYKTYRHCKKKNSIFQHIICFKFTPNLSVQGYASLSKQVYFSGSSVAGKFSAFYAKCYGVVLERVCKKMCSLEHIQSTVIDLIKSLVSV